MGRLFQKGHSGNPAGRPKRLIAKVEVAKREVEKRFALDVDGLFAYVEGLMRSTNERIALDAAKLLLSYRLGTPTQRVEMTGANGGPMQFEDARDKFSARIATLAARVPTSDSAERTH